MMPRFLGAKSVNRRTFFVLVANLGLFCGCTPLLMRPQSPDNDESAYEEEELSFQSVGEFTIPQGMRYQKIESVALVTELDGTGSDPRPSSQRQRLIGEMQSHHTKNPSRVLASANTSMVLVRGYLPPGVQKGDRFDVEVRVRRGSETKSLRGGWLLRSRLRQMEVLGGTIRTGATISLAEGPVIVDAVFEGDDDEVFETRGRVMGGGESLTSRSLGLAIRSRSHSILTTTSISSAINKRFYIYLHGSKKGVANPKNDRYIDLAVHPRYKNNLSRYMRVVRSIAVAEDPMVRINRILKLKRQLLEPTSSAIAALRLEAIGKEAVDVLHEGLQATDIEVRFYAAEALAYLDEPKTAQALTEYVENKSAFRWHALTALTAIDHVDAYESLNYLLHVTSVEARYGAFRALKARNPRDLLVKGVPLSADFDYHVVPTSGEPLVHFARSRRPEVVIFGHDQIIDLAGVLYAGSNIMIRSIDPQHINVTRYSPKEEKQTKICSTNLDELLRVVTKFGASYEEILAMLQEARSKGHLPARLVIDAQPSPWRAYRRQKGGNDDFAGDDFQGDESDGSNTEVSTPLPELFRIQADNVRNDD